MSSEIAIKVDNLSKCYQIYDKPQDRLKQSIYPRLQYLAGQKPKQYFREFWALRDVSFEIKKGETVGIIGRNGSGKSTLLQLICGTLNPTGGNLRVHGRIAALLELGSGFNPEFTGRENVYINAAVLGLSKEETDARFDDIIAFADIGDFIEQPVKTYSSGMMLRLAFAVIAHIDADILIIDEALAVGDAFFTQKCMRFLRRFMQSGTVFFVSHDTGSVRNLCTHAIWLEKGSIVQQGSPKEICENYLEAFYEAQQGKSALPAKIDSVEHSMAHAKDQRREFINTSNLRNDIRLFEFNPEAPSFGKGGAQIVSVRFLDKEGHPLAWVVGGEEVALRIEARAYSPLNSPIIGFFIKDRLGQYLFGDNTYLSYIDSPVVCAEGQCIMADFSFQMPRLFAGDYSITVAIANGTQNDHIQHHWMHDAIFFRSESTSVAGGLIGIPMNDIKLKVKKSHEEFIG
jgi:lipopolysaccharide transport system ATP-binding protein